MAMDNDMLLVDSITNNKKCAENTLDMSQADTNCLCELESCFSHTNRESTVFETHYSYASSKTSLVSYETTITYPSSVSTLYSIFWEIPVLRIDSPDSVDKRERTERISDRFSQELWRSIDFKNSKFLIDSGRCDDSVKRYRNNVHFMHDITQFIRDLMLYHLPNSVHSKSTTVGAFGARSSQIDYGLRKTIGNSSFENRFASGIDWYRKTTSDHRKLNQILRQPKLHKIYRVRYTAIDLINSLRRPLPAIEDGVLLTLYRGQKMTLFELEKLKNNLGELLSNNPFLSTSLNRSVADIFAGRGSNDNPNLVSVILKIYLDTGQPMRPYAHIGNSGEEDEVMLSPGTKFTLISCQKLHDTGPIWLLELKAIPEEQRYQADLTCEETFLLVKEASRWPGLS